MDWVAAARLAPLIAGSLAEPPVNDPPWILKKKMMSMCEEGQWGGNEPEESGSVATRTDGVGDINNHIKAVLGRGA